jgi:hypothetical protein
MDLTSDALRYLQDHLGRAQKHEVDGRPYYDRELYPIKDPQAEAVTVFTLSALVEFIASGLDRLHDEKLVAHVVSPTKVRLLGPLLKHFRQRECLAVADYGKLLPDNLRIGEWLPQEQFLIMVKSAFVQSDSTTEICKLAAGLVDSQEARHDDDGVAQTVTVKSGTRLREDVQVPGEVFLAPYRSFSDIEQVESPFIFRVRPGGYLSLHLADGGAWYARAVVRVKEKLEALAANAGLEELTVIA